MKYLFHEFMDFLKEYKIIALAIAFMMGLAANDLVKSLVDNIIMPLINPFLPKGGWETATFDFWAVSIKWGAFLSKLIYFIIIALTVFFIAKLLMKEELDEKLKKARENREAKEAKAKLKK